MNKNQLKLNKKIQNTLTFWPNCAKLILEYTGIVAYFDGQKSQLSHKRDILGHQNKKQKQKQTLNSRLGSGLAVLPAILALNLNHLVFETFCFLSKRFFVEKTLKTTNKNKTKQKYVSWLLSTPGHLTRNRSQQNHPDSLGRRGINSQSPERQSGLALLYQRASGRNYSANQRNRLFPTQRTGKPTDRSIQSGFKSLNLLISKINSRHVFIKNKIPSCIRINNLIYSAFDSKKLILS